MSSSILNRRTFLGFGSYDFSNSGYVLIFQSFLFPTFFASALAGLFSDPDRVWGLAVAGSTMLSVLVAPRVGAASDRVGRSRVFIAAIVFVGILAIAVSLGGSQYPVVVLVGFVIFNAVFEISQSLYDSFLKDCATDLRESVRLSTFAWGFGYLGGALFAFLYLWLNSVTMSAAHMLAFFAGLYLILSLPAYGFLRGREWTGRQTTNAVTKSYRGAEVVSLLFRLRTVSPVAFRHLAIYWLVVDAVSGVLYFAPLFLTTEVGLSMTTVGTLLLSAQLAAAPATYYVGLAANRWGLLLTIRLTLVGWILALVGIFMASSVRDVVLAMVPMVFVIGSTQALLRAHFSQHVARNAAAEGFGYYAVAQKSAAVFTPLLASGVAAMTGSLRPVFALLAVIIFLAAWLAARLPGEVSFGPEAEAK